MAVIRMMNAWTGRGWSVARELVCVATAWVLVTGAAQAQVGIDAFFGHWSGSGLSESEVSANFQLTSRDLDVVIKPSGQGGFEINWATIQRQKGNPNAPTERLKSTTMTFVPIAGGLWRSGEEDPLAGGQLAWARIEDNSLVIGVFALDEKGRGEMQIYRRTLSGMGMQLEFARSVDGEPVRSAKARLSKISN